MKRMVNEVAIYFHNLWNRANATHDPSLVCYCIANTGSLAFAQQQIWHSFLNTTVNNYANGAYGMKDVLANM